MIYTDIYILYLLSMVTVIFNRYHCQRISQLISPGSIPTVAEAPLQTSNLRGVGAGGLRDFSGWPQGYNSDCNPWGHIKAMLFEGVKGFLAPNSINVTKLGDNPAGGQPETSMKKLVRLGIMLEIV